MRAGDTDLALRLDPQRAREFSFEGQVRDVLTGEPVAEFTVQVLGQWDGLEGNAGTYNSRPHPFVDSDGAYRVGALEPMRAGLIVRAPGYFDGLEATAFRNPGTHRVDLALRPARSLHLRVVAEGGAPVPDARISVVGPDGATIWVRHGITARASSARTDDAGEVVLSDLPAGPVELQVSVPQDASESPRTDSFPIDLTFPRPDVELLELTP